jgi:hypothetical protein
MPIEDPEPERLLIAKLARDFALLTEPFARYKWTFHSVLMLLELN